MQVTVAWHPKLDSSVLTRVHTDRMTHAVHRVVQHDYHMAHVSLTMTLIQARSCQPDALVADDQATS